MQSPLDGCGIFETKREICETRYTLYIALTNTKLNKEEIARLVTFREILLFIFDIFPKTHVETFLQFVRIRLIDSIFRVALSVLSSELNFDFEIFLIAIVIAPEISRSTANSGSVSTWCNPLMRGDVTRANVLRQYHRVTSCSQRLFS